MNALCAVCPFYVMCESFMPDSDERNRKLQMENGELRTEISRERQIDIENGLMTAAGETNQLTK